MNQLLATYAKINRENPEMGALVVRSAQHFVWAKLHLAFSFQHFYMFMANWLFYLSLLTWVSEIMSQLCQCHIYTSKFVLPIPLECVLAGKDCVFNYVKLSFFCFLCPDRVGLPRALRGVSFSTYAGEKVTGNYVVARVIKKTISSLYWNVRGRLTDSISEWRTHINSGFSFL